VRRWWRRGTMVQMTGSRVQVLPTLLSGSLVTSLWTMALALALVSVLVLVLVLTLELELALALALPMVAIMPTCTLAIHMTWR
jgi:hypothetical protein